MIRRVAAASSMALALVTWGGVTPAQAALPLAGPLAICIADLPCLGTLMLVTAAAGGAVYAGSSASQKQGMSDFLAAGLSGIGSSFASTAGSVVDNLNPCGAAIGQTGVCPTIAQAWNHIAGSIEQAIGSGATSVPLSQTDVNAVQATGTWLVANPLPASAGWGASGNVQSVTQSNPCCGWANGVQHAVPIVLTPYAAATQVIAYQEVSITFPAAGQFTFCIWNCTPLLEYSISGDGSAACCPEQGNAQPTIRWSVDGVVRGARTNGADGAIGSLSGSNTRWFDGQSEASLAGTTHTLRIEIFNEQANTPNGANFLSTAPTATGIMEPAGAQIYNGANGGSSLVLDGANWLTYGSAPAAVAIPLAGVPAVDHLPKSVPLVPGSFVGTGAAGLGSLVSNPAATVTNAVGVAVPVVGSVATAGSFPATLAGVADAVAAIGQFVARFWDFSIPINWGRITTPIALMPSKFPFSIPFDVGAIVASVFNVSPVTPNASVAWCFHSLSVCPTVTVAPFLMDTLMPFVRWGELVLLVILAALGYRRWIGGAS